MQTVEAVQTKWLIDQGMGHGHCRYCVREAHLVGRMNPHWECDHAEDCSVRLQSRIDTLEARLKEVGEIAGDWSGEIWKDEIGDAEKDFARIHSIATRKE